MKTDGTGQRSVVLTGCTAPEAIAFGTKAIYFVCGEQLCVVDPVTAAWKTVPRRRGGHLHRRQLPVGHHARLAPARQTTSRAGELGHRLVRTCSYMGRASFDWMFAVNIPTTG